MSELLNAFYRAAQSLWRDYLDRGPGSLDVQSWDELKLAFDGLAHDNSELPAELKDAVDQLMSLASRCAERPEGLCFVTGEAGLVPRMDEHRRFDESLAVVSRFRGVTFER